jgi:hypothetical protein
LSSNTNSISINARNSIKIYKYEKYKYSFTYALWAKEGQWKAWELNRSSINYATRI